MNELEAAIMAAQEKNSLTTVVSKKYLATMETDSNLLQSIEALGLLTPLQWLDIYRHLTEQME
jgi:hypothetical protein